MLFTIPVFFSRWGLAIGRAYMSSWSCALPLRDLSLGLCPQRICFGVAWALASELLCCWDAAPLSPTFGHHAGSCYWWLRTLLLYLVTRAQSLGSLVPASGLIRVIDSQSFHTPTLWGRLGKVLLHSPHSTWLCRIPWNCPQAHWPSPCS